jgi:hypothetical protein
MKIELFHASGCKRCAAALVELQAIAATVSGVELDVLTLPAPEKLRQALLQRAGHN